MCSIAVERHVRRSLQDAVRRKDAAAVLAVVDKDVCLDFGGGVGIEYFKSLMSDPQEDFWGKMATVLAMGGTFTTTSDVAEDLTSFEAPYVASAWPASDFDPLTCEAVIGTDVRLRAAPREDSATLAMLDYVIVQPLDEKIPIEWTAVRLMDGRTGYSASRLLRSPIDRRATFDFKDGRWWMTAFVAGD